MYSPFHKTLPNSSLQMHWISVGFYEIYKYYFFHQIPIIVSPIQKKWQFLSGQGFFLDGSPKRNGEAVK